MRIGPKLIVGFVGIALLVGVVGYMSIRSFREITTDVREISETNLPEVEGATEMAFELIIIEKSVREYLLEKIENRPDEMAKAKKELEESFERFEKALESERKAIERGIELAEEEEEEEEEEELKRIKPLEEKYSAYKADLIKTITIVEKEGYDVADEFFESEVEKEGIALLAEVREFEEDAEGEIISEAKEVYIEAKQVTRLIIIATVVTFLLAISLGLLIARAVTNPITKLKDAAVDIAQGNMDAKIDVKPGDEIGELAEAFDNMRTSLKVVMEEYEKREKTE